MSGYRVHSYDPNAYDRYGPPLRPYNWVQWTGVVLGIAGVALQLAFLAGRAGWMPGWIDSPALGTPLVMLAVVLVNSRRQPAHDLAPELAPARKRWMIIIVTICVIVIGTATVVEFAGAVS